MIDVANQLYGKFIEAGKGAGTNSNEIVAVRQPIVVLAQGCISPKSYGRQVAYSCSFCSRMKILNPSQTMTVEVARARLATAENSVQSAKHESRVAKRKRKEAKQAARRSKKRLRRAKEELAEARRVVSEAEKRAREIDGAAKGALPEAMPEKAQAAKSSSSPAAPSGDPQFPVENAPEPAGVELIAEPGPAELQESESL